MKACESQQGTLWGAGMQLGCRILGLPSTLENRLYCSPQTCSGALRHIMHCGLGLSHNPQRNLLPTLREVVGELLWVPTPLQLSSIPPNTGPLCPHPSWVFLTAGGWGAAGPCGAAYPPPTTVTMVTWSWRRRPTTCWALGAKACVGTRTAGGQALGQAPGTDAKLQATPQCGF